jgi:hypothetical protein
MSPASSRLVLWTKKTFYSMDTGGPPSVLKQPKCEVDSSCPFSAQVKNMWSFVFISFTHYNGMVGRGTDYMQSIIPAYWGVEQAIVYKYTQ